MKESKPIYRIFMMQYADKEKIYEKTGKKSGYPDMGCTEDVGFYYDLDNAINALENNSCDIREYLYDAAFILKTYEGLYDCVSTESRIYFKWNEEKQGFFQEEEPKIFACIAL